MFQAPNHTQIPNEFLDKMLPHLSFPETKVLLVIMRKTFGWHKIRDQISLSQLEKHTGMNRQAILKATKGLEKKRLISKTVVGKNGDQKTFYELIIIEDSNNFYQCVSNTPPSMFHTLTKETPTKENQKNSTKVELQKGASPQPPPSSLFTYKRIKMPKEKHEALIKDYGLQKVNEMLDRLEEYADISPRKFKAYGCHGAVLRKWLREDQGKGSRDGYSGKCKDKIKEPNEWTKRYLMKSEESNADLSDKDTEERVSLGSLLGMPMPPKSPNG